MNKSIVKPLNCIGFIMDGNRRFAKERGESTASGHWAGKEKLFEVVGWILETKIPHAVFYAFSTENWQRSPQEVEGLLSLFLKVLHELSEKNKGKQTRIRFIGRREDFSLELQSEMEKVEKVSAKGLTTVTVWIALSYGGRAEIVAAVNAAVTESTRVTEESFKPLLWSAEMPDPDLIIRTGGEKRLSNFLPWQTVYSELFFSDTYWPAFSKDEFLHILESYSKRQRRIGQ